MKTIIKRIIFGTLLVLTFALIFGFSAANGEESGSLSQKVVETIADIIHISSSEKMHFVNTAVPYVRKLAHFSIYAFAGIWEFLFLNTFNIKDEKKIVIGTIIGLLYAISDEIHQGFSPGRSPKIIDVIIDLEGNMFGLLGVLLIIMLIKRNKEKVKEKILSQNNGIMGKF